MFVDHSQHTLEVSNLLLHVQWVNDDSALSDDIKAALECREADNQMQSSTAMVNQQQVFLMSCA